MHIPKAATSGAPQKELHTHTHTHTHETEHDWGLEAGVGGGGEPAHTGRDYLQCPPVLTACSHRSERSPFFLKESRLAISPQNLGGPRRFHYERTQSNQMFLSDLPIIAEAALGKASHTRFESGVFLSL